MCNNELVSFSYVVHFSLHHFPQRHLKTCQTLSTGNAVTLVVISPGFFPEKYKVNSLWDGGCGLGTYTCNVNGHAPVDVRTFTCKGLAAACQEQARGVKAPKIKSMHPKLPNPADKDIFMR